MGYSKLDITIRDRDHPCAPYFTTGHSFTVDIRYCDGTYFKRAYPLRDRVHDQIEVPPGSYIIRGYAWCNNILTDLAMVNVGCDQTVCVNLLPTTVRDCWWRAVVGALFGTTSAPIKEKVPAEVLDKLVRTINEALKYLPKDVFPFELTEEELRERLLKAKPEVAKK